MRNSTVQLDEENVSRASGLERVVKSVEAVPPPETMQR